MDGDGAALLLAFEAVLAPERRVSGEEREGLARLLASLLDDARQVWPGVQVAGEDFARYLGARVPEGAPLAEGLGRVVVSDLYLACACTRGDSAAAVAFEKAFAAQLHAAVEQARLPGVSAAEIVQSLRDRLLVGDAAQGPRISQYDGRGDLRSWLRVAAVRQALMLVRKQRREIPMREGLDAHLASDDPEIGYLKNLYRAEFAAAFRAAAEALEARDRNLLRYHYLDGLTLEQMAAVNGVHRATVARWLAAARETLVNDTQRRLRERIPGSETEIESLLRLVRSELDLSVRRLFRGP
jgi:RNA polymerase sigma-70 factor (ECF subfamily)